MMVEQVLLNVDGISYRYNSTRCSKGSAFSWHRGNGGSGGPNGSGKSTLLKCVSGLLRLSRRYYPGREKHFQLLGQGTGQAGGGGAPGDSAGFRS